MENNNERKLPIIGGGEKLIEPIKKKFAGGEVTYPRSFNEARELIKPKLDTISKQIEEIPEKNKMDEIIITIRLNSKFLAKSYVPNVLFRQARFENVGSRRYEVDKAGNDISKLHFIKTNVEDIRSLHTLLEENESHLKDSFKNDVRKIDDISLLSTEEVIQGFDTDWNEGVVEFVLHPYEEDNELMILKFKENLSDLGVDLNSVKIKSYSGGPNFISAKIDKSVLNNIAEFNPLRTIHPLRLKYFPKFRGEAFTTRPTHLIPPRGSSLSQIKVGIFDGGIDENHPFLNGFSNENEEINSYPERKGVSHGTAVAGVVLYGDLSQYEANHQLEDPSVFVESFRVLPLSSNSDLDMYEAIDFIEKIVPSRNDIDVYNLSFGPDGAISDDEISRFTFALDTLAWNHKKLFIVAVGNDGKEPTPYNRIQSPADLVNGLGVGAYTIDSSGNRIKADYSCVGSGREGCKVKPDLVAFGGDIVNNPIHVLAHSDSYVNGSDIIESQGTSFSTPLVSRLAAEILGRCNRFNPIVARALMIQAARNPVGDKIDHDFGYGILNEDIEEVLNCSENNVTIIYSNSMNPTGLAKLPIPLPKNFNSKSSIKITWTIATASKANALHVEDYTESAIEDTFYPHKNKYKFSKKGEKTQTINVNSSPLLAQSLISNGYIQSFLPTTSSPNKYKTEASKRGELKWDTIVKKWVSKKAESIDDPFLILHGMGRNGSTDRIDYSVAITISVKNYAGNLYQEILDSYNLLNPIDIRAKNEIMIVN